MAKRVKKVGQRGTTSYYLMYQNQIGQEIDIGNINKKNSKIFRRKKNYIQKEETGSIKAEEIPKPSPRPSTLGMTRITQRGT